MGSSYHSSPPFEHLSKYTHFYWLSIGFNYFAFLLGFDGTTSDPTLQDLRCKVDSSKLHPIADPYFRRN